MSEHLATGVVSVVTDNSGLTKGLARAQAQTEAATKNMENTVGKRVAAVGDHMTRLGRNMTASMTVPIIAAGGAATKMFADYESSLARVQTQAGASAKEIGNMRGELLKMAGQVGQTPKTLADGLYHIESAGFAGAKALNMLRASAKLAALGNANLEDTTQGVIAVMASHIKGINGASQAMAGLNAIVGTGDTKMEDLAQAMSTGIMAVAANTGLQFKDVGAALATLTDNAMQAEPAAMRLRMSLALMAAPSAEAIKSLKEIGLGSTTLADDMHKPNGLLVALEDLKKHLADSGKSAEEQQAIISKAFGGGQSSAAIQILLRELDRVKEKYQEQAKVMSPDTVSKAWKAYQKTTQAQLDELKSSAEAALIGLGEAVGPQLLSVGKQVASDVQKIANAFNSLPKEAQSMIVRGGIVMASLGPALRLVGVLTTGVGRLYDAALIVKKLASGNALSDIFGKAGKEAGAGGSAIGEMTVGTLIARSVVGGAGGAGEGVPFSTTAVGTAEAEAGGAGTAAAEKGVLAKLGLKLAGGAGVALSGLALSQILGFVLGGNTGKTVSTIGTGASAGAGIGTMIDPGLGTAIGAALGAGITEGIKLLKGKDYGQQVAKDIFSDGFGGQAAESLAKQTADALDKYQKLMPKTHKVQQFFNPFTGQWQDASKVTAANQMVWKERVEIEGPSHANTAAAEAAAQQAGKLVAKQLEAGWNQYKFQSEPVMFQQFKDKAAKLPPAAQAAAVQSAIAFSQKLENQGRLASGSTKKFIDQVENRFPGLVSYLGLQAHASSQAFEKKLDLTKSEQKLNGQLKKIAGDFPQVQHAMSTTAGDAQDKAKSMVTALTSIDTKGSHKMQQQVSSDLLKVANALKNTKGRTSSATASMVSALKYVASHGTKPMRTQAESDLNKLRTHTESSMKNTADSIINNAKKAASQTQVHFGHMDDSARKTMSEVEKQTRTHMQNFADSVYQAMSNGSLSTGKGLNLIISTLNKAMKELGVKSLLKSINIETLQKVATNANAPHGTPGVGGAARGTLMNIGTPGVPGHDSVPLNVGGTPITVAPGEQVAVFNRHQQPIVNAALAMAGYGGLNGLFRKVNTPNYMARGGLVPGFASGGTYTYSQLEGLWDKAGGPRDMAAVMAAIAEAESSGNADAHNASGASGLWQILGLPFPGNPFDALTNARMAVSKYMSQGLGAWTTYTSGAYRQFLNGKVPANMGVGGGGWSDISAPTVKGSGVLAQIAKTVLDNATQAANEYGQKHAPTPTVMGGGSGPTFPVAKGPVPAAVQWALQAAEHIAERHDPYVYGGFGWNAPGFDCSGYVSTVMDAAGIWPKWAYYTASAPINAHTQPGPGKWITIGTWGSSGENAHTMMEIDGRYFESGGPGGGGPHEDAGWSQRFDQYRHPAGYAQGGYVPGGARPGDKKHQPTQREADHIAARLMRNATAAGPLFALGGLVPGFAKGGTPQQSKMTAKQKSWAQKYGAGKPRSEKNSTVHRAPRRSVPPPINSRHSKRSGISLGGLGSSGQVFGKNGPLPFAVDDLGSITSLLGRIQALDGDGLSLGSSAGTVTNLGNQMTNLMNWWEAGLGAGGFPALADPNFNSWGSPGDFVIDTDASGNTIAPYISPNINVVAKELADITGMETATVNALVQAQTLARVIAPVGGKPGTKYGPVWRAIQRRQNAIKAIQKRVRNNLKQLKSAHNKIKMFNADKKRQQARQNEASKKLKALYAERKKLADHRAKLEKERKSELKKKHPNEKRLASLNKQIGRISDQMKHDHFQRNIKHWTQVYSDAGKRLVGDIAGVDYLNKEVITPLEKENVLLGGEKEKLGTGGEIGQIAAQLGAAATSNPLSIVMGTGNSSASGLFGVISQAQGWATQLGGAGGDIGAARLQLAQYQQGLNALLPGASAAAAADAKQQATDTGTGTDTTGTGTGTSTTDTSNQDQLIQLKAQLWDQEQQSKAVGAAQTAVLAQLPKFGGVFHQGGVVPGPLGAERLILAQGGEVVTPLGAEPAHVGVNVNVADGMSWLKQFIDTRIDQKTRTMSRNARRGLPGHGGGGF